MSRVVFGQECALGDLANLAPFPELVEHRDKTRLFAVDRAVIGGADYLFAIDDVSAAEFSASADSPPCRWASSCR